MMAVRKSNSHTLSHLMDLHSASSMFYIQLRSQSTLDIVGMATSKYSKIQNVCWPKISPFLANRKSSEMVVSQFNVYP